jgi:phosphate starvation-inducible PhoH-like protein
LAEEQREARFELEDPQLARALYGEHNANLKLMERTLGVRVNARANLLTVVGEPDRVALAGRLIEQLYDLLKGGYPIYTNDVEYAARMLKADEGAPLRDIFLDTVYISAKRRLITPKSLAQKRYIDAIRGHDIVFGIGPAGTGKTYLAMATAVAALAKGEVIRIVLTRPAVEAGERLGFLPGDLAEKVNPYLRPLYDALHDMMAFDKASKLVQRGVIEVAPLAFMRGRTLNDSFVILDEAQNTTTEQMKMFLTRLGFSSKAVVTGDVTQIDLPEGKTSGLVEASHIFRNIEGIQFVYFTERDVVRHHLVREIIKAYDELEERKARSRPPAD